MRWCASRPWAVTKISGLEATAPVRPDHLDGPGRVPPDLGGGTPRPSPALSGRSGRPAPGSVETVRTDGGGGFEAADFGNH